MTIHFADKTVASSQQRRQVHSSGELSVKCLVSELLCQRNVQLRCWTASRGTAIEKTNI